MTAVKEKAILEELKQLKTKMQLLGSLRRFKTLSQKGRAFAKAKKIKPSDVLKND